jgi:hypothetical protein
VISSEQQCHLNVAADVDDHGSNEMELMVLMTVQHPVSPIYLS